MTQLDDAPPPATVTEPATDPAPVARPGSRIARARMPIAAHVAEAAAVASGVCIRPVSMKATNDATGEVSFIDVPCGATLASKCPSCAERARRLRVHQCREGWHLDQEPDLTPDEPTADQVALAEARADITAARDLAKAAGDDLEAMAHAEAICAVDGELVRAGVRGDIDPPAPQRRSRSTRRRDDAPDLPKRQATKATLGRAFTGHDGTVFRPSMFITLTLPSYGRVHPDGTPVNPGTYDYGQAARDAIGFSALVDRFVQNLRRVAGYDVQYFAAVEPQRRLAAHVHFAIRGTIPRAVLRQVVAATYKQVWWPTPGQPVYDHTCAPVWHHDSSGYFDPVTAAALTTWDEALDHLDQLDDLADEGIGDGAQPFHVLRFGTQLDVQGLLGDSPASERRISYLAKYLTKAMNQAHEPEDDDPHAARQAAHAERLHAALLVEPCSPTCANWLRYGIQPKNARPGMTPGGCRSKAHKREHLGYAGRRILVSRKWTGKTLADHKQDRKAWVFATLGLTPDGTGNDQGDEHDQGDEQHQGATAPAGKTRDQWRWEPARRDDPIGTRQHRLLRNIAERLRWKTALDAALDGKPPPIEQLSATAPGTEQRDQQGAAA